mmetsp:Transcript_32114/g.96748  ORF Transcript_32114/g.96748 Transcript_32114/m.96748 type:complete len:242 (+) Transcript_32114:6285-7010(+)
MAVDLGCGRRGCNNWYSFCSGVLLSIREFRIDCRTDKHRRWNRLPVDGSINQHLFQEAKHVRGVHLIEEDDLFRDPDDHPTHRVAGVCMLLQHQLPCLESLCNVNDAAQKLFDSHWCNSRMNHHPMVARSRHTFKKLMKKDTRKVNDILRTSRGYWQLVSVEEKFKNTSLGRRQVREVCPQGVDPLDHSPGWNLIAFQINRKGVVIAKGSRELLFSQELRRRSGAKVRTAKVSTHSYRRPC